MESRRWDTDECGRGVADARRRVAAIDQLSSLADTEAWVAEEPENHLLPGLKERIAISGLSLDDVTVESDGTLRLRLSSSMQLSRREIRQSVWSIIGGAAELTTHVSETNQDGAVCFEVVTGIPPGGRFATHGHTLRVLVALPG